MLLPGSPLERIFGSSWALFGRYWDLLGTFWAPLRHLWAPLESSVSNLGQHLFVSYRLLGALGPPLASQEGPEAAHKASQNTQSFILLIFNDRFEYKHTNRVYTRNSR